MFEIHSIIWYLFIEVFIHRLFLEEIYVTSKSIILFLALVPRVWSLNYSFFLPLTIFCHHGPHKLLFLNAALSAETELLRALLEYVICNCILSSGLFHLSLVSESIWSLPHSFCSLQIERYSCGSFGRFTNVKFLGK